MKFFAPMAFVKIKKVAMKPYFFRRGSAYSH